MVINKNELIVQMIATQKQAYGRGERKPTVGTVGGKLFVTAVRTDRLRKSVRIGESMYAEYFISDTHFARIEANILQNGPLVAAK